MSWSLDRTNFERNIAVVIGINDYKNGIHPLLTPVNDASEIAHILETNCQYQEVIRLFDSEATLEKLNTLLSETLPNKIKPTEADAVRLLFYFAGHGIARNSQDGPAGYLIPQNAQLGKLETFLPMQKLHDALTDLHCHHLLVILDCCFAGNFRWSSTRNVIPVPEKIHREHYDRFIRYPAWQVITSAAHNQEAIDFLTDERGINSSSLHSPFANALIKGLEGEADLTGDAIVTAPELYLYLRDCLIDKDGVSEFQTPGLWPLKQHDRGEYIFTTEGFQLDHLKFAPPLDENNNPYRGLKPFDERHSHFFFGRKELIEELCDRISKSDQQLTVVLGASGSGKSSLVKAGLIPLLRNKGEQWYILDPMRPGESPFTALARAILPIVGVTLIGQLAQVRFLDKIFKLQIDLSQNAQNSQPLEHIKDEKAQLEAEKIAKIADIWQSATKEAKLLLIIDYFTELKTLCRQQEELEQLISLNQSILADLNPLIENLQQDQKHLIYLIDIWSKANYKTNLLLVIDQFEELITLTRSTQEGDNEEDKKEWQRFLEVLAVTITNYPQKLRIVVTLRSDFEPRFLNSPLKSHWEKENARFPVRPMNSDELRQAIEGPALKQALYFEPPELVSKLIDEIGQMPGALPLLSFTLSELYIILHNKWVKGEATDRALKEEYYRVLGGVAGSVTRRATQEYESEELDEAQRATMRRAMLRMLTIEGGGVARRRVLMSELDYPDEAENKRRDEAIARLVKARLIIKGQEKGEAYIEPAHDHLVRGWDKLQEWIKKEEENLALQQRLTSAAKDWKTGSGALWTKEVDRLARLEKVLKSPDNNWLNKLETEFVIESNKQRFDELKEAERQRDEAIEGQISALASLSEARMLTNDRLGALFAAVKAGVQLKKADWLKDKLGIQTKQALEQAVYGVQERNRFEGNTDPVYDVIFSPDGKTIATANWDNTVKLWSIDGTLLKTFKGHTDQVNAVAFSRNGNLIVSGSKDKTVKVWSVNDGTLLKTFQGHSNLIWGVNFNFDDKIVASASGDGTVKLWSVNDGNLIKTIQSHSGDVKAVSFSPDKKTIASGGWDQPPWQGKIKLWSFDGTLLNTFNVNTGVLRSINFSSDGKTIICAGDSGVVQLLQTADGYLLTDIKAHDNWAMGASISSDGKTIASVSIDETVKFWSLDGSLLKILSGHADAVYGLGFSPDGKTLATASADKTVRLWSVDGPFLKSLDGKQGSAHLSVSFSPDGKTLASASWDTTEGGWTVKLWSTSGKLLKTLTGYSDSIRTVSFSSDGNLIASASWDGTVKVWTIDGELLINFTEHGNHVNGVSFSPDGRTLISAGYGDYNGEHWILWWNINGKLLKRIKSEHTDQIYRISFSPDGKTFATASWDRTVKLWNIKGELLKTFTGHSNWLYGLSFSPDSKMIASGSLDRTVKLWNTEDGKLLQTFEGHNDGIYDVSFSPNGKIIASASLDKTVKLWSIDGTLLKTISGHNGGVYGVSFSLPDGQIIASASWDGSIKLWSAKTLDFDSLLEHGCNLLNDYLKTNPNVSQEDRLLCHYNFLIQ
ncbi:hypothetical protein WA1_13965 [Scytonema hofmannii PCC 7110]|uniref:Uncharacterized protein n=1 Tax=Scytonema hofmannii PCC 7110 TaxID=128403 RepID=A0A139XET3_9CYAN|nr:caspase family protein [Scytonema hofmannii]KYC43198.1 hypothetical protein WA1_13965 [Scytonema hofmannii PCC 7110]